MIWIPITLLGVYLAGCFLSARGFIWLRRHYSVTPDWLQEVPVPSSGGPNPTWITPNFYGGAKVIVVCAHGYKGNRDTWTELIAELVPFGVASVVPCMPGQDHSPEPQVGFGLKESEMLLEVVAWVRGQFETPPPIVLMGLSMGGSAVWMAAVGDPSIAGVISQDAFSHFGQAMDGFFERKIPGGRHIFAPVMWMAAWMSGLSPHDVQPILAAEKWKGRPALVIQGEADSMFGTTHAYRLAEASGADLWMVPGADHAESFRVAPLEYVERVSKFLRQIVGEPILKS